VDINIIYNSSSLTNIITHKILFYFIFHSCTVHLDTIESFIYPTDAQLDCSKNAKIYIKVYKQILM